MHFVHWKVLSIIAVGVYRLAGATAEYAEDVRRATSPSAPAACCAISAMFSATAFFCSAPPRSLSYIPLMSWVAVSLVILIDDGGLTTAEFAWTQVPVFSAVIIANLSVARG